MVNEVAPPLGWKRELKTMFPKQIKIEDIPSLFKPKDTLCFPLATGQPMALLGALSQVESWEDFKIFTGLLSFPFPLFTKPGVHVTSGYYGPLERFLNAQGASMDYLPASFRGIETFALKSKPRVIAATLSPADADGFHTFGTHGAAAYRPFVAACENPDQITIAEINATMPIVYGHKDYGDNKIHQSKLKYFFETSQAQLEPPSAEMSDVENQISKTVADLIPHAATIQFGIGGIPNEVANILAAGQKGDFGIHSELISDGFLKLCQAGKITNSKKGIFDGASVFTFALGQAALYDFLDEQKGKNKRRTICLPVSIVNDPHIIAKNKNFTSINSGFIVDFAGQVCSEAIGLKQYSGVGGQLSFVQGAYECPTGLSIICIKSTATIAGKKISNIVATLPPGSMVSTPRHYTQVIVTEYGSANLYGVPDEKRAEKLIPLAHPDFRDELKNSFEKMKKEFYEPKANK